MKNKKGRWAHNLTGILGILVALLVPILLLACCSYDESDYPRIEDYAVHLEENASYYARNYSEWHPEEAILVIRAYESGELLYGKYPITEDEYQDATESLAKFYEYFLYEKYR